MLLHQDGITCRNRNAHVELLFVSSHKYSHYGSPALPTKYLKILTYINQKPRH